MYNEAWEKYKEGFKMLLPFILVKLLWGISSFKFIDRNVTLDKYDMITGGEALIKNISGANVKALVISNLFLIIVSILVVPLVYSFLYLVIKMIVRDEEVNYKEAFDESLQFYIRYLTLSIIIIALIIGISFLGIFSMMVPFFMIAVVILLVYVVITVIPCEAYLIYHDVSAEEALSKGREIGKKYFWKLVVIGVITSLIGSALKIIPDTNIIVYAAKSFITISIGLYMHIFAMTLCKEEEN